MVVIKKQVNIGNLIYMKIYQEIIIPQHKFYQILKVIITRVYITENFYVELKNSSFWHYLNLKHINHVLKNIFHKKNYKVREII